MSRNTIPNLADRLKKFDAETMNGAHHRAKVTMEPWDDGEWVITVDGQTIGQSMSKAQATHVLAWLTTGFSALTVRSAARAQNYLIEKENQVAPIDVYNTIVEMC